MTGSCKQQLAEASKSNQTNRLTCQQLRSQRRHGGGRPAAALGEKAISLLQLG
jgi:hypothetical protein